MYALSGRSLPTIRDYGEATKRYATTSPWRGRQEWGDARPLCNHRKKYLSLTPVNRVPASSSKPIPAMVLTYHNTEVVTWFADGQVTLDPGGWNTVSTRQIMDRYAPGRAQVFNVHGVLTMALGKMYRLANDQPVHFMTGGTHSEVSLIKGQEFIPWWGVTLDKRRTMQALRKHRYPEFRVFARAYYAMSPHPDMSKVEKFPRYYEFDFVEALADRARWRNLAEYLRPSNWMTFEGAMNDLREAIYAKEGGLDSFLRVIKHPVASSWSEAYSWVSSERRYARWM